MLHFKTILKHHLCFSIMGNVDYYFFMCCMYNIIVFQDRIMVTFAGIMRNFTGTMG